MIESGILLFAVISALGAFVLIRKYDRLEKSELTSYLLVFVWGAFLLGLSLTRFSEIVQAAGTGR